MNTFPTAPTVGSIVVDKSFPRITRTTLALYAGASGDHNPMHIDIDFAKKAGFPDVFAQGMLVMAMLGQAAHRRRASGPIALVFDALRRDHRARRQDPLRGNGRRAARSRRRTARSPFPHRQE